MRSILRISVNKDSKYAPNLLVIGTGISLSSVLLVALACNFPPEFMCVWEEEGSDFEFN